MTAPPPPPPGWYPGPNGANTQRYFDGTKWTEQLAPFNLPPDDSRLPPTGPQRERTPSRRPLRPFVIMLIAGSITAIVSFFLMQLALNVHNFMPLVFHIVGFVLFVVWLASIVATVVGLIGTIVRIVRQ